MDYNFMKWNVELIQDPNILLRKLKEFNIKNKKIKNIIIVRHTFNFEELSFSDYNPIAFRDSETFLRHVEIDAPFIIEFEDNSRFEIDYSDGSTLKVGYNSLPKDLYSSIGNNLDGNIMFSNCIGKEIIGYSVEMTDEFELDWDFCESYGINLSEEQESYISRLKIHLTDQLYLNFTNYYDYGAVWVSDSNHHTVRIRWDELRKGFKKNDTESRKTNSNLNFNLYRKKVKVILKNGKELVGIFNEDFEDEKKILIGLTEIDYSDILEMKECNKESDN